MSAGTDNPSGSVSASDAPPTTEQPVAEPTATVAGGEQTSSYPAGSAQPEGGIPATEKPEVLVGAAFAGGFVAALLLRKIVG